MIKASYTPQPIVYVLDSVVDTKTWMVEQTQPLHDHLKAHQFKFERIRTGETCMFYKEWSTDSFWLPSGGLSILPGDNPIPTLDPKVLQPFYDEESLCKLEATIRKISAYLDRANANSWWMDWLEKVRQHTVHEQAKPIQGVFKCDCHLPITYKCSFCF